MSSRGLSLAAAAATVVVAGGTAAGVLLSRGGGGGGGAGGAFPTPAELSNTAACTAALGSPDVSRFRVALPLGDSPYGRASSAPVFLPLFSSARLDAANDTVETALVVLHGLSGDANDYFCNALSAVWAQGGAGLDPASVAVIAPWFGDEQVPSSYWDASLARAVSMFWTTSRWLYGGNNSPGPAGDPPVQWSTSFDGLDALVAAARAGQWPRLRRVVIAGFSAGAQLASRYAWARRDGGGDAGAPLRVIVSDPGSFLYLDRTRPAPECRPLRDTFANASACASFVVPPADSGCADSYDEWKYGVGGALDSTLYTAPLAGDAAAVAAQTAAFARRDTRYVLGTDDACNCNTDGYENADACFPVPTLACTPDAAGGRGCCDTWPDSTTSNAMDTTCEGMLQGSNRLQRGKLYGDHLARALPGYAPPLAFFAGGHNARAFYASAAFTEWAFTG